jgi:hypothetical protein
MATGTITVRNPNGKSGTFKVVSVGPDDDCTDAVCGGKELTYVDPQGDSGVQQGQNAIGKIVDAGNSGVMIVINLQPQG